MAINNRWLRRLTLPNKGMLTDKLWPLPIKVNRLGRIQATEIECINSSDSSIKNLCSFEDGAFDNHATHIRRFSMADVGGLRIDSDLEAILGPLNRMSPYLQPYHPGKSIETPTDSGVPVGQDRYVPAPLFVVLRNSK